MRWPEIVTEIRDEMRADAVVLAELGAAEPHPVIGLAGTKAFVADSIEFSIVSDVEGEVFNRIRVQWDIFATTAERAIALERALRRILHHDLPVEFGPYTVWSQIVDARVLPGPEGDGIWTKSLDQLLTPVRSKYQRSLTES